MIEKVERYAVRCDGFDGDCGAWSEHESTTPDEARDAASAFGWTHRDEVDLCRECSESSSESPNA